MDDVELTAAIFDETVTLEDLKAKLIASHARARQAQIQDNNLDIDDTKGNSSSLRQIDVDDIGDEDEDTAAFKRLLNGDLPAGLEDEADHLDQLELKDHHDLYPDADDTAWNADALQDALDEITDLQHKANQQNVNLGSLQEELMRIRMRQRARGSNHPSLTYSGTPESTQLLEPEADMESEAFTEVYRMIEEAEANLPSEDENENKIDETEEDQHDSTAHGNTTMPTPSSMTRPKKPESKSKPTSALVVYGQTSGVDDGTDFEDFEDDDDEVEQRRLAEAEKVIAKRMELASQTLGVYLDEDDNELENDDEDEDDDDDNAVVDKGRTTNSSMATKPTSGKHPPASASKTPLSAKDPVRRSADAIMRTHGSTIHTTSDVQKVNRVLSAGTTGGVNSKSTTSQQSSALTQGSRNLPPLQSPLSKAGTQSRSGLTSNALSVKKPSSASHSSRRSSQDLDVSTIHATIVAPLTPQDYANPKRLDRTSLHPVRNPNETKNTKLGQIGADLPSGSIRTLNQRSVATPELKSQSLESTTHQTSTIALSNQPRLVKPVRSEVYTSNVPAKSLLQDLDELKNVREESKSIGRTTTQRLRLVKTAEQDKDDDGDDTGSTTTEEIKLGMSPPQRAEVKVHEAVPKTNTSTTDSFSYRSFIDLKSRNLRLGVSKAVSRPIPGRSSGTSVAQETSK